MTVRGFSLSLGFGGLLFLFAFWLSGMRDVAYLVRLADAFTLPAITLLSGYLLSLVSGLGFFDIFSYSVRRLFGILIPRLAPEMSYRDYKAARERANGSLGLLASAIIFLLPALVFTVMSV